MEKIFGICLLATFLNTTMLRTTLFPMTIVTEAFTTRSLHIVAIKASVGFRRKAGHRTDGFFLPPICRHSLIRSCSNDLQSNLSRESTLRTLLLKHGAPGSIGCRKGNGDLQAVSGTQNPEIHPYLQPLVQSISSGHFICVYRTPWAETDISSDAISLQGSFPIVETYEGSPGFRLLSMNGERLMRRIVCECDATDSNIDLIDLYNEDAPEAYDRGSVKQFKYGVDKYVLMHVGPFPDLYQQLALSHEDEQSSLIAAETSNRKLPGFASNYLFYAKLLTRLENREEETRDAARMCLRLPLASVGMDTDDFEQVAVLGQLCTADKAPQIAMEKLKEMYELIKEKDQEDQPGSNDKTPDQRVIDECTAILDEALLSKLPYSNKGLRNQLSTKLRSIGRNNLAELVEI